MRKVILSMMVSIDGYMESRDPTEYWTTWDEEMAAYMMDFFSKVDTFIYGRKAYEAMIDYWPPLTDPFATIMNQTPKLIFSRTLENVTWNGTLLRDNGVEEIKKRKLQPGKDMALFAGANLAATFIEHNLIDEYRLIVNPIVLAEGKPLFGDRLQLKLRQVKTFSCGNVILYYEPPVPHLT
jgi:dihydrofolate reductase